MKKTALTRTILYAIAAIVSCTGGMAEKNCETVDRLPRIRPDYTSITIPPNIGPLNFVIEDSGTAFCVKISSSRGSPLTVTTSRPSIRIPAKKWSELLANNKGGVLRVAVYVKSANGSWRKFKPIEDSISREPMDSHLLYRTIGVLYNYSRDICIYQRNLETNKETEVLNALNFFPGCCNCHTMLNNDPHTMFLHVRTQDYGNCALLVENGKILKINARLQYTSWHPSGALVAYSINNVDQCFHAAWKDIRDVFDHASSVYVYDIEKQQVVSVPELAKKNTLETWPCWSRDGKFLYFCSAPVLWTDDKVNPPPNVEKVKYSLMRISYDRKTETWGAIETVLSANATGLSITQPRISPDGAYLLFCMHDYGPSPYAQASSDLYMMNCVTRQYWPLSAANSAYSESWHSWSTNGRWIAFSSKRDGGILTRIYLGYIDSMGQCRKPFVLPQNDPEFYDSFTKVYNVPEFASGPVTVSQKDLVRAIRGSEKVIVTSSASGDASKNRQEAETWPQVRQK